MESNSGMTDQTMQENRALIAFWDKAFASSEGDQVQEQDPDDWKALAPSLKLFRAALSLGQRKKVLDFGCGNAWAGIIAAKGGCTDVTAVDAAPGAVRAARLNAAHFGVTDRVHIDHASPEWLQSSISGTYDGLFCSNVLDVIPPETAEIMIREFARIMAPDACMIVGLNYYLSPETAAAKGIDLKDGNRLYMDGVLRLVSRSDEEWARIFSRWYRIEWLEHFAWPEEGAETRRLFFLRNR